ncbi:double-CXXCG motif protein [Myxococcus sp. RHSTA-1-4]|nr:double-CXXCG motif protein [Myxococcus sp. RHSTA-1-4]MBZ4418770.1 double-CXXCG motif protein [Myxococcus sp. RHSTA-1-4]
MDVAVLVCGNLVGTERFVETVRRLGIEEVEFRELPVR